MKIFVTGGTGFIGSALVPHLLDGGHEVCLLARASERGRRMDPRASVVEGDPTRPGPWTESVAGCDAAVNLAGAPIFCRWTPQTKQVLRDSRVLTTRNLVAALPAGRAFTLLSASAVGIYGDAGERELDEAAPLGTDFLAGVARDWEQEALVAERKGVRTVIARFAVVLGPGGGALEQLVKATRNFAGGPVGKGTQWFSWVHRLDLLRALSFLLERRDLAGIFNLGAPNPARQVDVARVLGRLLHRPAFVPTPAFALRMVLGEFADVLLFGQKVLPRRLQEAGFAFEFPEVEGALREILGRDETP